MIRIWNYNVSRLDEEKGVKLMLMTNIEETQMIFYGQIDRSTGNYLLQLSKNYETITFTTNRLLLSKISQNDWLYTKYK